LEKEESEQVTEISDEKKMMIKKIDTILDEYYLNGVQRFAA